MGHELFGERFLSFRQPAWHGLGQVIDDQIGAVDALEKIGKYEVTLEDLFTSDGFKSDSRSIIRHPTADDPNPLELGTVQGEYVLITPTQVCEIWDASVQSYVETIGSLYRGSTLFISTKLPTISVKGDEVENYLLLISPMSGSESIQTRVTPIRVVCNNTLMIAKSQSSEHYRIVHDRHAVLKLQAALDGVYSRASGRVERFQEIFNLMADKRVTNEELNSFIDAVYVLPTQPDVDDLELDIAAGKIAGWEQSCQWYLKRRELVLADFEGQGVGSDSKAFKGTLWGAYNAVAEVEGYSRSSNPKSRSQDILMGYRGGVIEKAYTQAYDLVRKP